MSNVIMWIIWFIMFIGLEIGNISFFGGWEKLNIFLKWCVSWIIGIIIDFGG